MTTQCRMCQTTLPLGSTSIFLIKKIDADGSIFFLCNQCEDISDFLGESSSSYSWIPTPPDIQHGVEEKHTPVGNIRCTQCARHDLPMTHNYCSCGASNPLLGPKPQPKHKHKPKPKKRAHKAKHTGYVYIPADMDPETAETEFSEENTQ